MPCDPVKQFSRLTLVPCHCLTITVFSVILRIRIPHVPQHTNVTLAPQPLFLRSVPWAFSFGPICKGPAHLLSSPPCCAARSFICSLTHSFSKHLLNKCILRSRCNRCDRYWGGRDPCDRGARARVGRQTGVRKTCRVRTMSDGDQHYGKIWQGRTGGLGWSQSWKTSPRRWHLRAGEGGETAERNDCREGHSALRGQAMPGREAGVCLPCWWNEGPDGRSTERGDRNERSKWEVMSVMMKTLPGPLGTQEVVDL